MVHVFRCQLRSLHAQSAANPITDWAGHPVRTVLRRGTLTTAIFPHAFILSFGYHKSVMLDDQDENQEAVRTKCPTREAIAFKRGDKDVLAILFRRSTFAGTLGAPL
jgi:hypothetical protein